MAIPMFNNKTPEVGVETYFTESLRSEFERSRLAKVTSKNDAQVIIEGTVKEIKFLSLVQVKGGETSDISAPQETLARADAPNPLPKDAVLTKEYATAVKIVISARKVSDNTILWEGDFNSQRNYRGPLLGTPGLSNSNPLYNQSARQDAVSKIAKDLMSEAHDRITENF